MFNGINSLPIDHQILNEEEIRDICIRAFQRIPVRQKKVLFIIPDNTRSGPVDIMFRIIYEQIADQADKLDFLVALGTHPPLSEDGINQRLGLDPEDRRLKYPKARIFNHAWRDPGQLATIGKLSPDTVREISNGLMTEEVAITINKMVLDYDLLIILGPVFPHEVVGFSGGNKYLFPGIAGKEIIDMFHWLGALITNPAIIGKKYTPVRAVVDRAAAMVPVERYCLSMVVSGKDLAGLYFGTPEEAWEEAADLSDRLHIIYKDHPFSSVLSCAPEMYDDLWVGGKCMYKLEPVVADGGELIIYAPHITEISTTHGEMIRRIGYHVRDYFLKQPEKFRDIPGGVMAHSTHVRGIGTFENGIENPRIRVILATGIPEETCRAINLGYRDPATVKPDEWMNRENEGVLYVPKAGELLYRLKNQDSVSRWQ